MRQHEGLDSVNRTKREIRGTTKRAGPPSDGKLGELHKYGCVPDRSLRNAAINSELVLQIHLSLPGGNMRTKNEKYNSDERQKGSIAMS